MEFFKRRKKSLEERRQTTKEIDKRIESYCLLNVMMKLELWQPTLEVKTEIERKIVIHRIIEEMTNELYFNKKSPESDHEL